ncbi:geranylgeranylglyceryl/heptaprenylglyceryl phosphate synthase [Haladaptatus halobius]|uniref:geranylgeranylglyceryl/heptaprenylglyceryl phosphate synthase n=1 Tax=Haladaptatus halobius TaxID=2884875 RepID=UPI002108116F|nr:geranylgeranylglyceryl/heptaprenylglyceryl phosphate synthase [Haladaptatus halobius]
MRSTKTIDWEHTYPETYIVLNPVSAIAIYTRATCDLDAADIATYAEVAEHLFGQEIVYLETSGALRILLSSRRHRILCPRQLWSTVVASTTTTQHTR